MGTYLYGDECRFSLVVNEDLLDAFADAAMREWGYEWGRGDFADALPGSSTVRRVGPRERFWLGDASWGYGDALGALLEPCEPGSFVEVMTLDDGLIFERFERTESGIERSVERGINPFCKGGAAC